MFKIKLTELQLEKIKISLAYLYPILAIIGGLQQYLRGEKEVLGQTYTHYNNYLIFKTGAHRFLEGLNPFIGDATLHFDTLKYSPPFCLWMNLIAWMPNLAGILTWNILNGALIGLGLWYIPLKNERLRIVLLLLCFIEALTSFQNLQSNALIVGCILLAVVCAERKLWIWAPFLIMFAASVKIFALAACLVFFFYEWRWKLILWSAVWFMAFALSPMLVTGIDRFGEMYLWWYEVLSEDYSHSLGMSVMNMFNKFGFGYNKTWLQIIALAITVFGAIYYTLWDNKEYRIAIMCSVLMYVVAFNQRAESPTFVIAAVGAVIYLLDRKMNWVNGTLLFLVFYLTIISATDLFPRNWREEFTNPYGLKVLPIFLVWMYLQYNLLIDFIASKKAQ